MTQSGPMVLQLVFEDETRQWGYVNPLVNVPQRLSSLSPSLAKQLENETPETLMLEEPEGWERFEDLFVQAGFLLAYDSPLLRTRQVPTTPPVEERTAFRTEEERRGRLGAIEGREPPEGQAPP